MARELMLGNRLYVFFSRLLSTEHALVGLRLNGRAMGVYRCVF
jgi:hypothetical protein